jgi:dienelactone hydrolase
MIRFLKLRQTKIECAHARGLLNLIALLVLLACVGATVSLKPRPASESVRSRMQRLLGLPQEKAAPKVEVLAHSADSEMIIEDIRYQAAQKMWVPAMVLKPLKAPPRLPAIICLPGTGGTRQQLADARLQLSSRPRTGWARALAREGFLTLSLDYRGSEARGQNIFTDAVRAQLAGRNYMGLLVQEVIRAIDYLLARSDVDGTRIGITGFSLGGAMSWYAAAADPRISVIVPVCGGAGTYDDLLRYQPKVNYHSQYFYPAGFLKLFPGDQPEVFASLQPRAVLIVGRDQDQGMPVEGLRKLEQEVKAVYSSRGVADRFAVYITAGDHTYTDDMFAQVSEWFQRFLKR